jgi:hypothetical protein
MAYVRVSDGKTIWLGEEDFDKMTSNGVSGFSGATYNWDKGTITIGGQEYGIQTTTSSVSVDGGSALLIVGGVVVAAGAATAVYFYTHPEVWDQVTTSVQNTWNNVTTSVQNAWNNLTGQTPTAENAEAEPAEQIEQAGQTQAAA